MKIFLIHLLIWLLLSVIFFFFISEPLTIYLFPEIYDVTLWLPVLGAGLILIFIIMLTSYIICIIRQWRKKRKKSKKKIKVE